MTAEERTLAYRLVAYKNRLPPSVAAKAFPPDPALEKVDTAILYKQAYCYRVQQAMDDAVYRYIHYGTIVNTWQS